MRPSAFDELMRVRAPKAPSSNSTACSRKVAPIRAVAVGIASE